MSETNTGTVSGTQRVRKPRKPKKSQIPYAILLTALIIALRWKRKKKKTKKKKNKEK